MNRHPSRAFRRWCAGLILLVFTWSLPGSVEARVSPIELVKLQLKKPNFLIVVESAESMQGLPGENAARYNEVGVDCEKGDRFCRLYGQAGRCEFSGVGAQGYVFDDVPMGTNTTTSTATKTGGIQVITQTDTRVETNFTTGLTTSTGANTSGQTEISTDTGTQTAIGTLTSYQTATTLGTETYNQTAKQTGTQTVNTTSTLTGTESYRTTSTVTGTETYRTTSTVTGTETYNGSLIATDGYATAATSKGANWSFPLAVGSGSNKMVVIFTAADGSASDLAHSNVKFNGVTATYLGTATSNRYGNNYHWMDAWAVPAGSLASGSYNVTGTANNSSTYWSGWMMAISFSGVLQAAPTAVNISDNTGLSSLSLSRTASLNDWFVDAMFSWSGSTSYTYTRGAGQTLVTSQGNTGDRYLGYSISGPLSVGTKSSSWTLSNPWTMAALLLVHLTPAVVVTTRTATTTNTGTTTNTALRTVTTTNTGTTTNTALRTVTTTNTGTTTNTVSQSITTTNTETTTNTSTRVGSSTKTASSTDTVSATQLQTQTATVTKTAIPGTVVLTGVGNTTNTETKTATYTVTATVTTTYAVHPVPDTDNCDALTGCSGASYCYLQSSKSCTNNADCTTSGDFCRRITLSDGTNRTKPDSCVASNPINKICRYQAKSCSDDSDCRGSTTGLDHCVTGAPAQMCQKTGLWCSAADTNLQCSGSDDKCGPATSRMMMVKNAVRRVFLEHAYDDSAVVKIGQMHTYQANGQGSTDNLFPYVKLAEPTFDQTESKFLPRAELLRGTDSNGKACFSESDGPSSTCTIDYGGGGATTTPSVVYALVSPANNSRYAIPTGDGKTFVHADDKWATCGLSCSFPSAATAGTGSYEGSYYTFSYRRGVPIDAGDPNSPTLGSVRNPQYYSTYRGKSFGSSGNYWMLMDAERSDIVNENKYGARDFVGATWSSSAEYSLPYSGTSGDPLSTSVACSSSNGAQWDHNVVPMVNATTFGGQSLTPPEKALLNVARLEKNSFGGFHAVGSIAPVACALKNDGANDTHHSVEGYMNSVRASDAGACWQNHVLLVVDGLPRGPGDLAVGGIDCSADACKYDTNPTLSGCSCPAVEKARSLAASGVNVHVIAATRDPTSVNVYAAETLNNIAIAGSTSSSFINRPRYATSEDELYFWLNYEMKEALRVRIATTPASAANGSQSLSGITAGNMLYQTVAEPPEWRGSLIGYQIGTVSVSSTSTSTSTGTGTGTEVAYTTTKLWDAAMRNGWVSCLATQAGCNVPDNYRWKSRNVFFSDTTGVVRKIGVDSQGAVDSNSKTALLGMGMGANPDETERIVQWMLGKLDSSETVNPRPLNPAVMGSVINSMPISVGPPGMSTLLGGNHFYYTHNTRTELVYVGSDDGMLHAFRASDGAEAFAFIPADMVPVIAKLYAQGGQRYSPSEHIYGLSGSPKVKNLCVENCNPTTPSLCSDEDGGSYNEGSCPVWKTVLIMGEGQGGNHPFALDITDPPDVATGLPQLTSSKLLWHVGHKNASAIPASELGDTMSVPAFAYKKSTEQLDQRVLMASSYPVSGHSTTKLIDAKLIDGGTSGGAGLQMSGSGCTQDFGMVADVALARDYTKDGAQSLIAAYLADTHGTIHQYAPGYPSAPGTVMSLGCNHPLHFSPAVVQLNRNDPNNINGSSVFLAQVTNSLLDSATRGSSTPSKLVVKKLTSIGNSPPAADASFGISGEIHLSAGTTCTGPNCLCGVAETIKTSSSSDCGSGGSTIPDEARPTGTPVAVIRTDGAGFQLYTTWYKPPASNWDNCQTSDSNGTSYITLHEFLSNGTWAQIAGIEIPHQYVTGVQFVGTTLFVTYGLKDEGNDKPGNLPNLGQTFVSVDQVLKSTASDRFVRTAWAERLDM